MRIYRICATRGRNPDNPSERKRSDGNYRQTLEIGGGVSNTLTSVEKDNYLIEMEMENKKIERPKGKGWVWDDETRKWFRIRKLTPRECFRLMDVSETDIDKIQNAGISKSQQYKMAGNSIVVACLAGIFGNLFDTTERIKTTLF